MTNTLKTITFKDGMTVPILGQGTWKMGDIAKKRHTEIESLQTGIELGMTLIDTAEMYGEGKSERLVGEAIAAFNRRDLFLVSKVYPWNAGKTSMRNACLHSLERLGTDYLDLYLLHWPGSIPLEESVECFEALKTEGLIRSFGVSNFDLAAMQQLFASKNGNRAVTVQNLYHLGSRGVEFDLLPWLKKQLVPLMAYCPLAQAGRLRNGLVEQPNVRAVARKHNASPYQILLAFVLSQENVIAIPKAATPAHVKDNRLAADIELTTEDLALLERAYPTPKVAMPLDIE